MQTVSITRQLICQCSHSRLQCNNQVFNQPSFRSTKNKLYLLSNVSGNPFRWV